MRPTDLIQYVIAGTIILLIVSLLVTQLVGQPFIIFVKTGSMEPTLQPNDGYLAVPAFFAGQPEKGDVILFKSQELGGGELTSHRVVRKTERGYITKGDANPFTDQAGDEPPVSEGQIKSVALQINGDIVVIPGLGATVTSINSAVSGATNWVFGLVGIKSPGVTTVSTGVLVVGLALFVFSLATGGVGRHARDRSKGSILRRGLIVIAILTLVVIIPVNFSMLLPSGVYQIEIVSAVEANENERIIQAGESSEVTYFMQNSGHLPVMVFIQPASDGVETPSEYTYVPRRTVINRSVTLHAPNETGTHLRFVREFRYLVVLPPSLIAALHRIHPLLAMLAINVTVAGVVITVALVGIGTGRVRLRSRSRDVPIGEGLRRRLPPLSIGRSAPSRPSGSRDPMYNWSNRRERQRDSPGTEPPPPPERPDQAPPQRGTDQPGPPTTGDGEPDASGTDDQGFGETELDGSQLIELYETLQEPPVSAGFDATRWRPELLAEYLEETYGVTYSPTECVRLLERAGIDADQDNT